MVFKSRKLILFSWLSIALLAILPACSDQTEHQLTMMPLDQMPSEVRSAAMTVQQAYRFAAANPPILQQIPCYCGCGAMGHTSNYACYWKKDAANGAPTFENHALGCSICVDITQDTMRLLKEGKNLPEIKAIIDGTYSKFGPSNIP